MPQVGQEESFSSFLNRLTPRIEDLVTRANDAYWRATAGQPEAEAEYAALRAELLKLFADRAAFRRLQAWEKERPLRDPLADRQLVLLHREYLGNQTDPLLLEELVRRETEIEGLFTRFRALYQGRRVSDNEIRNVLQHEADSARRREAWEASKQVGREVAEKVVDLVKLRNRIAHELGFRDYYALALFLSEIDENELFRILDALELLTDAPFASVKAAIDAHLAGRFGVAHQEIQPWHYRDPFFQEAPVIDTLDLDRCFAGQDLVGIAARFYARIGLPVDDILARSDLYERDGKNQHAYCIDIDREGDVRILCNLRQDERWMSTLLHELGHAAYDRYHDAGLPFLLRTPAHILTTEAIALLMGRLTKDATWLSRYAALSPDQASDLAGAARQQLARGQLIFVRWGLVMVHFERELYRDPDQDLNALWLETVRRLQRVEPPTGRNEPDWAAKIHIGTAPVYYQNYILGELVASQLAHSLGESWTADPRTGAFLQESLFRPGARSPWPELIRLATGEPLNPEYFARQFVTAG